MLSACSSPRIAIDLAPSQSYTKILRFDLHPARHDAVECLATLPTPSPAHSVRAIEPTSRVVAFGQVLSMCFVQWETKQYAQVPTSGQDEELVSHLA